MSIACILAYLNPADNVRPNLSLTLTIKPSRISIALSNVAIEYIPIASVLFATYCLPLGLHNIPVFALPFYITMEIRIYVFVFLCIFIRDKL